MYNRRNSVTETLADPEVQSFMSNNRRFRTIDIVMIALFAAIIAVCAWITVPFGSIPFTLQVLGVFLALTVLGGRNGTISVCVYILMGAIGLPVFSGFQAGFGVLAGVTGGYIVGFVFSGLVYWLITSLVKSDRVWVRVVALLASLVVCYAFGSVWFLIAYAAKTGAIGIGSVLMMCVVPYIIPDLAKLAVAMLISEAVRRRVKVSGKK